MCNLKDRGYNVEKLNDMETKDWFQEGNDWYKKGDYSRAIECSDRAIELNQDIFAYGIKGSALHKLGRNEEAIECFDKVIEFDPDVAYAYYTKGDALRALGKYEAAIECYDKAIELDPDLAEAYNNKGIALTDLGKYETAIECFDKTIELKPDHAYAYNNKRLALKDLGKYETKVECFNKAIELKSDEYVDIVVVDSRSIHIVPIIKNATRDDVLAAYMRISGEGWHTDDGRSYCYWTTTHSPTLYSIRREIKKPEGTLGFLVSDIDIANWWAQAYPIIEQIANVTGAVTGIAAITSAPFLFVKWIRSKKVNKEKEEYNSWEKGNQEYTWVQNILRNDSWNISSLSQKLSITEEETKKLLKGFGYVWDSRKMLYIATENTEKLRNIEPEENHIC